MSLARQDNLIKKTKIFLNTNFKIVFVFCLSLLVIFPVIASAQELSLGLEYGGSTGLASTDLRDIVVSIIRILFGLLGLAAVSIVAYAGYLWQTSQGDSTKIDTAKKILKNGLIGLAIILSSYAITEFIIRQIVGSTNGTGSEFNNPQEINYSGSVLGGGVIQMVHPAPGSNDVPRNTLIMVAFKQPIKRDSIVDNNTTGCPAELPPGAICGHAKENSGIPTIKIEGDGQMVGADKEIIIISADNKQVVVDPVPLLGSAEKNVDYVVTLSDSIKKENGSPIFFSGGFSWNFTTSTVVDSLPPMVVNVQPIINGSAVAMNAIVQVNFSEPINAVSASGIVQVENGNLVAGSWQNAYLKKEASTEIIGGKWEVSNGFRTIEFIPDALCKMPSGQTTNSCGKVPYCLPSLASMQALVKAAVVDASGVTADILSGINDAAGNSLDGGGSNGINKNRRSTGRPANGSDQFSLNISNDNFFWTVKTSDQIDLVAPFINNNPKTLKANPGEVGVPRNDDVSAEFSENLRSATVNSENISLFKFDCLLPNPEANIQFPSDSRCFPPAGFSTFVNNNKVIIRTYGSGLDGLTIYNPRMNNQIQDLYQNCFNPAIGPCDGFGTLNPHCGFRGQPVPESNQGTSTPVTE